MDPATPLSPHVASAKTRRPRFRKRNLALGGCLGMFVMFVMFVGLIIFAASIDDDEEAVTQAEIRSPLPSTSTTTATVTETVTATVTEGPAAMAGGGNSESDSVPRGFAAQPAPTTKPPQQPVTPAAAAPTPRPTRVSPSVAPTTAAREPTAGGGGGVYYKNCAAARAAGAAPVRRGDPGYRSALDRDNDGVGCE